MNIKQGSTEKLYFIKHRRPMRKLLLLIVFAITGLTAAAQPGEDKNELQQTKQRLQKEIEEYRQLLEKTKKDKKNYMSKLSLINSKINARLRVIDNINRQVKLIDDDIYRKEVEKNKLRKDLDTLKARYAKSMEYAYKNRSTYDYVNFLFSASGINDALRRMAYLKAYRAYREQQVETIMNTQTLLKQKIEGLNATKKQKGEVLNEQSQQLGVLEDDKKEKDQIVKELKSQEKEINKQITARRAQQRKIDNAIAAIIERERKDAIARAKEKERLAKLEAANNNKNNAGNNPPPVKTSGPTVKVGKTPDASSNVGKIAAPESVDIALSNRFEDNKGKLPWPVDGANTFILMRYGQQEIDKVKFFNNGLNFQTNIGAPVKVVFDGVVSSVIDLGDGDQAVFVRHGNKYISSYVGLSSVTVSKGQEVKVGQVLGKAGANDEGVGETQLLISPMDRGGYLNPELWIRRGK